MLADLLLAEGRQLLEDRIADAVAEVVVDRLEAVDVEQGHGQGIAVALGAAQLAFGQLHEVPAVERAGQWIGRGQPAQLELVDDDGRQILQQQPLEFVEIPGFGIDDAERAQGSPGGRHEGSARVEADVRVARDERVVGEALVLARVVHDEDLGLPEDGVRAEGDVA